MSGNSIISMNDGDRPEILPYTAEVQRLVGKRIRDRRNALGMSMADLAEDLDYSDVSQVSKIETGDACCGTKTLYRLAQALDVSLDYLFFGDEIWALNQDIASRLDGLDEDRLKRVLRLIDMVLELSEDS